MLTSLSVVCPVFAVIAAGFACGRLGLLGPTASSELNRFVVYLGLPALLFQAMAEANWPALWQPGFIASFAIGVFVIFGGTLIYRVANGHHLTDASIDGLNAGYANVGYIGFPLCELIFGRQSLALVTHRNHHDGQRPVRGRDRLCRDRSANRAPARIACYPRSERR